MSAEELGWRPEIPFADGLAQTIRWYAENQSWIEGVRSGSYRTYYQKHYGLRLESSSTV